MPLSFRVAQKVRTASMLHEEELWITTLSTVYSKRTTVLCKECIKTKNHPNQNQKHRDWHLFLPEIKAPSYLTEIVPQINKPKQRNSLTELIYTRVPLSQIQRLHFILSITWIIIGANKSSTREMTVLSVHWHSKKC